MCCSRTGLNNVPVMLRSRGLRTCLRSVARFGRLRWRRRVLLVCRGRRSFCRLGHRRWWRRYLVLRGDRPAAVRARRGFRGEFAVTFWTCDQGHSVISALAVHGAVRTSLSFIPCAQSDYSLLLQPRLSLCRVENEFQDSRFLFLPHSTITFIRQVLASRSRLLSQQCVCQDGKGIPATHRSLRPSR